MTHTCGLRLIKYFGFVNDVYVCLCYSRQGIIDSSIYDSILENMLSIKNTTHDACNFIILGAFAIKFDGCE